MSSDTASLPMAQSCQTRQEMVQGRRRLRRRSLSQGGELLTQYSSIEDNFRDSQLFLGRAVISLLLIGVMAFLAIARLVYLQVIDHEHYTTLSRENRVKLLALPPTRGLIYDRNGVLLAENLPAYSLEIIPEQVADMDATLIALSELLAIDETDIARFQRLRARKRRFESIPIRFHLGEDEVARFAVQRYRFPGVDIQARLDRFYPMGELTSHVLGYVGRIDDEDLKQLDTSNYSASSHVGKVGIEKTYEDVLHGQVGVQQVEINAVGRIVRVLDRTSPVPGNDLHLNLDIGLQAASIDALGEFNGAVVALDPTSGGVLALVSKPGFDPNLFVDGISMKKYRELNSSRDKPLFNRALRGQYPPGSTLKPFVGLAGLEHHVTTPEQKSYCPGFYTLPNHSHRYRDWKRGGHGSMNLHEAIEQSCDVYFYGLARSLGIDRLHSFLSSFGFGAKTGIDLTGELPGLMPSKKWKRQARHQPWFPGETLITGIGQGFTLATPLQLSAATATLVRRGRVIPPRVVQEVTNPQGEPQALPATKAPAVVRAHSRHWQLILDAMRDVVHGERGTARKVGADAPYEIAGKTGTAQVFTLKQHERYHKDKVPKRLRDHALFIALAPVELPRIAVAVVVENGGGGSSVAAPIARQVLDYYLLGPQS
jgi:penicillin-binding protein 2